MSKIKKILCMLLVCAMITTQCSLFNTVFAQTEEDEPLKIEVSTDKSSYSSFGIANITVTVTNTSDEIINNISAEAVFEQLAPINSKTSETYKEIESLQSGESFTFSYKATLNANKVNINFFEKIILWFVRLFNGGYNATSHNIEAVTEDITEIKFGKYTVQNVVSVDYEKTYDKIPDADFKAFQDIRESIENLSTKEEVIEILEDEITKGNIKDYQVDETCITFETVFGIKGVWEDETYFSDGNKSVSLNDKSNIVRESPSGNTYADILNQVSSSSIVSSVGDIAVIRPYRSTDFQYDDFLTTGEILADAIGADIDVFDNTNATVSVLENLDNYGIVLVDSHGSLISGEPYICLTQTFNNQQVSSSDLNDIVVNQNNQIRVHSSFFENNYADNAFDDCLIFLGTCYSMYDSSFSDILIEKGVDCVYGYTNIVSVSYCNITLVENMLENLLLDGDSSSKAYNETISVCGKTDPKNKKTDFVMQNSKNLSLYGAFSGLVVESVGASNKPLVNVTVTAENDNYKVTGKTDANGKFTLKLPLGTYKISLSLENYTSTPTTITVDENTTNQAPYLFFMKKDDSSGGDTGSEKASVHGTVIDSESQQSISNVKVTLYAEDTQETYTTVTDEIGDFSFENLTAGRYTLSFEHEDYTINETNSFTLDGGLMFVFTDPFEFTKKDSAGGDDSGETTDPDRTVIDSGNCGANGDNVTWTLYDDGELVISGSGTMKEYGYDSTSRPLWYSYSSYIKTVKIENSIKNIGSYAFSDCANLTNIIISDSVTNIGGAAFKNCENLKIIIIPDNVTRIGDSAFYGCHSLASVTIGSGVKSIGNSAFSMCSNLKKIEIPTSVTSIYDYAFSNCDSLASVVIPKSVTYMEDEVFYCCDSLADITVDLENNYYSSDEYGVLFNKNKTELIKYPQGNTRTSYIIPDSVIVIGERAFSYCTNLTNITISNNVTSVESQSFEKCYSLTNISISNSIISIGWYAFSNCTSLTDVYYTGTQTQWDNLSIDSGNTYLTNATIHYNS